MHKCCLKLAESPNIAPVFVMWIFMGNHLGRYYHDLIKGPFWIRFA